MRYINFRLWMIISIRSTSPTGWAMVLQWLFVAYSPRTKPLMLYCQGDLEEWMSCQSHMNKMIPVNQTETAESLRVFTLNDINKCLIARFIITMTSWWTRLRLKSPASRLFTQSFIQAQINENIKAPRHWPLFGEFTGDRWIPRTKGQLCGIFFHLMTSSCV